MGWGAMHIVQQWQEREERPERVVLVGAADAPKKPGSVSAYRWRGGPQEELDLQQRIHEAVTGVVSLDNLLAIGSHFAIWPEDCLVVQCDIAPDTFGRIVIARERGVAPRDMVGFSLNDVIADMAGRAIELAKRDDTVIAGLEERSTRDLAPAQPFIFNRLADLEGCGRL